MLRSEHSSEISRCLTADIPYTEIAVTSFYELGDCLGDKLGEILGEIFLVVCALLAVQKDARISPRLPLN